MQGTRGIPITLEDGRTFVVHRGATGPSVYERRKDGLRTVTDEETLARVAAALRERMDQKQGKTSPGLRAFEARRAARLAAAEVKG